MTLKTETPARGITLAARNVDHPRRLIFSESKPSLSDIQAVHVARRFRLPLPTAAMLAAHIFMVGARR